MLLGRVSVEDLVAPDLLPGSAPLLGPVPLPFIPLLLKGLLKGVVTQDHLDKEGTGKGDVDRPS